jgi:hypothetical protein
VKNQANAELPGACSQSGNLAAYLLNALPEGERAEFERHLGACPACARLRAAYCPVIERLEKLPGKTAPGDLTAAICARLTAADHAPRRFPFPTYLRVAAAVLAAVGLSALFTLLALRWASRPDQSAKPPRSTSIAAPVQSHQTPPTARPLPLVVSDARAWLQRVQNSDGGWTTGLADVQQNYAAGVSALALLAFMDRNPAVFNGPSAPTVRRGINHLISLQQTNGLIGPQFSGAMYNQGLATRVLVEAGALETNAAWQAAATRAVEFLCRAQADSGGWAYLRPGADANDLSVSIWPLQALIRADALGYPGLRSRINQGLTWLRAMANPSGQIGYNHPDDFPYAPGTMAAAGVQCYLMDNRELHSRPVQALLASVHRAAAEEDLLDYYRFYFMAAALDLANDQQSRQLAETLQTKLVALQTNNGGDLGSWQANDRWGNVGGRVYATALATLAVQSN